MKPQHGSFVCGKAVSNKITTKRFACLHAHTCLLKSYAQEDTLGQIRLRPSHLQQVYRSDSSHCNTPAKKSETDEFVRHACTCLCPKQRPSETSQ